MIMHRYLETYWSRFENVWFHGDYVYVDDDNLMVHAWKNR